jgi:hypothetical protein
MPPTPQSQTRPNRLPALGHALLVAILLVSLASGIAVWLGQSIQLERLAAPAWLRPALLLHGCLFPVQSVLFGVLLATHIRTGWQLRANRPSGLALECVFAALICTGAALYYVGDETWRDRLVWSHRLLGLLLPVTLGLHWFLGHRWARLSTDPLPPARQP